MYTREELKEFQELESQLQKLKVKSVTLKNDLDQVVESLIVNAEKFGPKNGIYSIFFDSDSTEDPYIPEIDWTPKDGFKYRFCNVDDESVFAEVLFLYDEWGPTWWYNKYVFPLEFLFERDHEQLFKNLVVTE